MSAPIDDLLYGGDDSGDDDELNAVPMSSFSAPLPSTGALAMGGPPGAVPLGAPSAVLAPPSGLSGLSSVSAPPPMSAASVSAPVSTMTAPCPLSATGTAAAPAAATTGAVKQQGSGHQMFQQMFALLKQMLPPEQYAALHSEMRNGNGNDIKSIVDIIKRIAGDAIFASVIQRMDLTRNHSAAAGSLGIVKAEPAAGSALASVGAVAVGTARPTPISRPGATPPSTVASTSITQPIQPISTTNVQATTTAVPPPKPAVAIQRPTLVTATAPQNSSPAVSSVKTEPVGSFSAPLAPPPDVSMGIGTQGLSATVATTVPIDSTGGVGGGKNETQEKIQFAKKLLFHASSCTLPPGNCQVKRCDDVRRVFKHSVSCGGARGCSHCRQLKALVEYHAKECLVPVGEHCKIPFCDGIRRNNAAARARAVSAGATSANPTSTTAPIANAVPSVTTQASTASALSDDDEDNTPLASAVNKAKKNAKAKSPKSGPVNPTVTTPNAVAKKKVIPPVKPSTSTPASNASTPSSTGSSTPGPAPVAVANKPKPASATLTQAQEYGRLLQLILHVEKCKTSTCAVGEDCVEAKTLLRQVNAPDAPVRAQTYKKVFAHYKVCLAKSNTQNCPMCKIGLLPIEVTPVISGTPASSGTSQPSAGVASATITSTSATATPSATSPSVGTLKRTNSSLASPRSPSKKPRLPIKGGKPENASTAVGGVADQQSLDLMPASRNDLRREEDVLTHTGIDLNTERRAMMDRSRRRHIPERLPCKKEEWMQNDLFNSDKLTRHVENIANKHGVSIGVGSAATSTAQVMAHALHEYLKQIIEEMVEAAKLRGDVSAQALEFLVKKELSGGGVLPRELTSTDILRVSCDDSFVRLRQEDVALRTHLLEDAKREELAEKERSKKRKKVDRVKLQAQEEKDEAEMDLEELAVKDLKERLLQEDKDGTIHVDGRVNESIATKLPRRVDDQVTMEDATYWLENQKPYINPKLFVRAEAARIVTKALL